MEERGFEMEGDGREVVRALLLNTGLSGFRFDTSFCLQFSRNGCSEYGGSQLPWAVDLRILANWWFNEPEEWLRILDRFPSRSDAAKQEAALAYELVCLRWGNASAIRDVRFISDQLVLDFGADKFIVVELGSPEDYAWMLCESGIDPEEAKWRVVREGGSFFCRIPVAGGGVIH